MHPTRVGFHTLLGDPFPQVATTQKETERRRKINEIRCSRASGQSRDAHVCAFGELQCSPFGQLQLQHAPLLSSFFRLS